MNFKNDFKDLFKKLETNAFFRALVFGILIASGVLFVVSLIMWILNKPFWIGLIPFAIVLTLLTFVFYIIFKPNDKKFAKRLDELGLKQRVITMNQYRNDDSLIANIQRKNAIEHINKVDRKQLKLVIPTLLLVFASVSLSLGVAATTVSALSNYGVIENGGEVIPEIIPGIIKEHEINYSAEGNGEVLGDFFQIVKDGEDGEWVVAMAFDGWYFSNWSDGLLSPERRETEVSYDINLVAIFKKNTDDYDTRKLEEMINEGVPTDEENKDRPFGDPPKGGGEDSQPGDSNPGQGQGGMTAANNQVIDGQTYYGDEFGSAYGDAMDGVASDSSLSGEIGDAINGYFGAIAK